MVFSRRLAPTLETNIQHDELGFGKTHLKKILWTRSLHVESKTDYTNIFYRLY